MLPKIIADRINNLAKSILKLRLFKPYWVEITTQQPSCIYYFGSFDSHTEAKQMHHGYIEDLVEEKAVGISVKIKRCMPTQLTITEEESLF